MSVCVERGEGGYSRPITKSLRCTVHSVVLQVKCEGGRVTTFPSHPNERYETTRPSPRVHRKGGEGSRRRDTVMGATRDASIQHTENQGNRRARQ